MKHMNKKIKLASWILYFIAIVIIFFGFVDLFTPKILPYHELYLGISHKQLHPKVAELLLISLRVIGVLLITLGITQTIIIGIPFRKGENWAWWFILISLGTFLVPLLFITLKVGWHSPWWLIALLIVLWLLALLISRPPIRPSRSGQS